MSHLCPAKLGQRAHKSFVFGLPVVVFGVDVVVFGVDVVLVVAVSVK